MTGFKDHFSVVAKGYSRHRPVYPAALTASLAAHCRCHERALDVGCGTGQLSVLLAEHFRCVRATDASQSQIDMAQKNPRVTYVCEPAERMDVPERSADLIVAAQAAHWFDLPRFYSEVRRVGRRGDAVIALVAYDTPRLSGEVGHLLRDFYHADLAPYWPAERHHVDARYQDFDFPFAEIEVEAPDIVHLWRLPEVIGYFRTWSALRRAEKSGGMSIVETFERRLAAAWGDPAQRRAISWPLIVRVGRL